ncbi:MAG: hypothetical protein ACC742_14695 [Thermoanaerobaculales bacterium]
MWTWSIRFVVTVSIGFAVMAAPGHGQAGAFDSRIEARLQFEAALQALAGGDLRLAAGVLHGLAAAAEEGTPERKVYETLAARAEGRVVASEEAVLEILAETSPDDFTSPWVYDELVRRGAEVRLAGMKRRATADLEALLARHYEARGGLDRLRTLSDLVATGRMLNAGQEIPFRLYRKRPRFYRLDLAMVRGIRIIACDGQVAWRFDPTNDSGKAEFLSGELGKELLRQSYFDDVLIRYPDTGESVYLAGIENLDGADAHRIEVDLPGGGRHSIFLDAESFLEVRRLVWADLADAPAEITYEYRDVDGLPMPARQTVTTAAGTVEYLFDAYELQQPINARIFDAAVVSPTEN